MAPPKGKPLAPPISPEQRAEVIELARKGTPRNEIHRLTGVSTGAVSAIARKAGITFDRSKVKAATEARQIDLAARRTRIIDRGYTRIEKLQDRLEAETFKTIMKATYGAEVTAELKFVPTVDERNIADTISRYVVSLTKLEAVDADARDKPAVDAWLDAMTDGGGKAAPPPPPTPEGPADGS